MKLYKLTDQDGNTQNSTHWDVSITHKHKKVANPQLCSGAVFHAYTNLNLAFLLNPSHANISNPRVWECEGTPAVQDWGKVGCFSLTITKQLETPAWIKSDKAGLVMVSFAILCAEAVLSIYEIKYPNDDRPRKAIEAAKKYLRHPSADAARAAYAAYAAADAAYAAAYAADAAVYAAAYAADAAARADTSIDFGALADKAVIMQELNA